MKQFTKYICAFLMMVGMSVNAWGTTENISFATCEWGFPAGSTGFGYFSYDGYKIYADGVKVGYYSSTYYGVILEKNLSSHIQLPAIPGTISSIVVTAYSGASTSANLSLYVDGVIVSSAKNIGNTSASWTGLSIPANAVVKLQNDDGSGGKATQITGVTITHNGSQVGGTSSSIPDGNYEIEAMPAVYGQGTATSNVAYSEAYETVTFTATPASGYTFDYWEITYVSSCTNSDLGVYSWIDASTDATCRIYMPAGKVTATAYFEESDCTTQGVLVYDESEEESQIGYYGTLTSFDLTYESDGSGAVTWTSTNTDVATVVGDGADGATVTVVGAGSADIKASVAEDATYCAGVGVYELVIEAVAPTVTNFTASCTHNTITVANDNASTVSNKGDATITRYGYLYSTSVSSPTFGASGVNDANVGTSDVTLNAKWAAKGITSLSAGTTYYVRAYAYNGTHYGYSSVVTITTKCAVTYAANGGSGTTTDASSPYAKLSDVTVLENNFTAPENKVFDYWSGSDGNDYHPGDVIDDIATNITLTAQWRSVSYTDAKFSCADWSVTGPSGDTVFITSTASKTVRSQEAFHVTASGLPASTALTFTTFPANTRYAFKKADGSAIETDTYGKVNTDFYVFYTPTSGDTSDGLDEITKIYVSVSGEPRKDTLEGKTIIGRHLPTNFVIAAKRNGKWVALPSDMTTGNPSPVEIAVDDDTNPSIAYTVTTNIYSIAQPAASEYIRLKMNGQSNYPLFGSATGSTSIGKSSQSNPDATPILDGYLWKLVQKRATGLSNPQEAKYLIYCKNHSSNHLRLKATDQWGLYDSGIDELRIIPASESTVVFAEASVVAWGKKGAIIESKKPYDVNAFYIVGKLPGGIKSDTIELRETRTSKGSGTGTRYNYTVDFGSDFDFSASEGQMLTLEWFNILKTLKAVSNVTVPRIVASNTTINSTNYPTKSVWNTEVHVLPGDTLTIDASGYSTKNKDVTIKELNIYPGAAVIINKDTLKATNLVLRSGWSRIGEKRYAVGNLYINPGSGNGSLKATNAYMDWYIDYDQYYPIAVPWKVATSSISYKNMVVDIDQGLIVRYYDGERHAKGGDGNTNWKQYSWDTDMPTHLVPGIGYAITARRPAGKAFSIIRMPLTIPSAAWTTNGEQGVVSETHKDQVSVTAWVKAEGETPDHAKGWNFIANPYMCNYKGDITHSESDGGHDYDIGYVNIPDVNFKEFDQVEIGKATLKPGSGFLIQTEKTGTLTFGTSNRKASAPSFLAEVPKASKQKAYITLSGDDAEDEMGLIISERYTAEYEINADLEKLLSDGNTLRTYMIYNNINMAYVAINEELAKEWIPVTVRIPATGEYTFSLHEASVVGEMEGIYLIDYESNTITNLIENNYSFVATGGTVEGRFAINAIAGQHETPTDIDIINAGGDIHSDKPVKFLYHDKVFIYHRGVIYDATGKKIKVINK